MEKDVCTFQAHFITNIEFSGQYDQPMDQKWIFFVGFRIFISDSCLE